MKWSWMIRYLIGLFYFINSLKKYWLIRWIDLKWIVIYHLLKMYDKISRLIMEIYCVWKRRLYRQFSYMHAWESILSCPRFWWNRQTLNIEIIGNFQRNFFAQNRTNSRLPILFLIRNALLLTVLLWRTFIRIENGYRHRNGISMSKSKFSASLVSYKKSTLDSRIIIRKIAYRIIWLDI